MIEARAARRLHPGVQSPAGGRAWLRLASFFSVPDLLLFAHLATMWSLVALAPPSSAAGAAADRLQASAALLLFGCIAGRGPWLSPSVRAAVYRLALVATVVVTYLMLRASLPIVRPGSLDAILDRIDVAIFGLRPTVWLEPRMSPLAVEILAGFYLAYFVLCAAHALVVLAARRSSEALAELTIGTAFVFGVGQLGYVLVPGFGPVTHLADHYQGPLQGGLVWQVVLSAVETGGALKDVFPSLHTAASLWFALHAARRSARGGGRWWTAAAVVTGLLAGGIAMATVVLRWHYAIDVAAGALLGIAAAWISPRLAVAEARLRRRHGLDAAA